MKYDFEKIPATLRGLNQWVCWKAVKRKSGNGKVDKIPISPKTGKPAKTNDHKTWASFQEAVDYWRKHRKNIVGVGFVFTKEDPYCGLDLDHCVTDGELESWAQRILKKLNSYAEMSPSGAGVHAILKIKGELPRSKRKGRIEFYSHSRFFTMTGNRLDGFKPYIAELTIDELKNILSELFQDPAKPQKNPLATPQLSDDEILRLCQSSKNFEKFNRLWNGDWSDYPSQSEADAALCSILAFYTRDPEQIDRLFRQSRLCRKKWDERRFADGRTYGEATIRRAIESLTETYSPPKKKAKNKRETTLKIDFLAMAQSFIDDQPLYYDTAKNWWMWTAQRWKLVDETDILSSIVLERGIDEALSKRVRDVLFEALKVLARRNKPRDLSPDLIQLKGGVYDLQSDVLKPASPDRFIAAPIPWEIGDSTETPTIDRLFRDWVGKERSSLLYEIIAFCLLPSYPIHRIFFLLGSGANGKSSFLRIIERFLGDANCVSSNLERLVSNIFEPARLYKKLACFIGETDFGLLQKTNILKQLTGEDVISGQHKFKKAFDFKNHAKILIATNTLPMVRDKTDGFFRRTLIVHFPNQFPRNKNIISEIPDLEFENLARKSIEILKTLLARGSFTGEGSVDDKRREYEDFSNPLNKFVTERCVRNEDSFITTGDFYETFQAWLKENKLRVWTNKEIKKSMDVAGFTHRRKKIEGRKLSIFEGLEWKRGQRGQRGQRVSYYIPYKKINIEKGVLPVLPVPSGNTKPVVKNRKPAKPCGLTPEEPGWIKEDFKAVNDLVRGVPDDLVVDSEDFKIVEKKK